MAPEPYWKEHELPWVLRNLAKGGGPILELALNMAAEEIERLRELTNQDRE